MSSVDAPDPSSERIGHCTDRHKGPDREQDAGRHGAAAKGERSRRRAVGPLGAAVDDGGASYAPLAGEAQDMTAYVPTASDSRAEPGSADDRLTDDLPPHYDRGV